jgi:hypothetical protein
MGRNNHPCTCGSGKRTKDCFHVNGFAPALAKALENPIRVPQIRRPGETFSHTDTGLENQCEPTARDRQELIEHWEMFEDNWNDFFKEHESTFGSMRMDTSYLRSSRPPGGGVDEILKVWLKRRQTFASKSGILHENHIRTLGDVLLAFTEDNRSATIQGGLQSGKTTLITSLMLLGPLMFLHSDFEASYAPLLLVPNINSLFAEAQESLENNFTMYSNVEIRKAGKIVVPGAYFGKQVWPVDGEVATSLSAYEYHHLGRKKGGQLVRAQVSLSLAKRRPGMEEATKTVQQIINAGHEPMIVPDETQWGPKEQGVMGNWLRTEVMPRYNRPIFDVCNDPALPPRIVNVSATTYPCCSLEADVVKLRLQLDPGYHGFNSWNGDEIDPSCDNTEPDIRAFSDIDSLYGTDNFQFMHTGAYNDSVRFDTIRDPDKESHYIEGADLFFNGWSHGDYKRWYEDNLVQFINSATATNNDFKDRDDMAFRLIGKNAPTEIIKARIAHRLDNAVIYIWNSETRLNSADGKKVFTAAATIEYVRQRNPGKAVVLWVTGGARMGDPFPESVRHFVEFSREATTHTSLEQGFFGRACGYGKTRNAVYYNDDEALRVIEYVASGCNWACLAKPLMQGVRKVHAEEHENPFRFRNELPGYIVVEPITPQLEMLFSVIEPIAMSMTLESNEDMGNMKNIMRDTTGNPELDRLVYPPHSSASRHFPIFAAGEIPMPDGSCKTIDWGPDGTIQRYFATHPEVCRSLYGADSVVLRPDWTKTGWPRIENMHDYSIMNIKPNPKGNVRRLNRLLKLRGAYFTKQRRETGEKFQVSLRWVRIDDSGNVVFCNRKGMPFDRYRPEKRILTGDHWKLYQIILPVRPPELNKSKATLDAVSDPTKVWHGGLPTKAAGVYE